MVDTADLKSSVLKDVWVRVPPSVPNFNLDAAAATEGWIRGSDLLNRWCVNWPDDNHSNNSRRC